MNKDKSKLDDSKVTKKSTVISFTHLVWEMGVLTKNTENSHIYLKYTDNSKYNSWFTKSLTRKLLSIWIERETC